MLARFDDPVRDEAPSRLIPVGGARSHYLVIRRDGTRCYVADTLSGAVIMVDPEDMGTARGDLRGEHPGPAAEVEHPLTRLGVEEVEERGAMRGDVSEGAVVGLGVPPHGAGDLVAHAGSPSGTRPDL